MAVPPEGPNWDLQGFREYLRLLARAKLGTRVRRHFDASDIVQQTLLEAQQNLHAFRGNSEAELAAWLRKALANNLADALRGLARAKRDVTRERSLDAELEASSQRLNAWFAAEQLTPSQGAARKERGVRLAAALAQLPEAQREALTLRHLDGHSLAEIACRLNRTPAGVVGLLQRGLKALRGLLQEGDEP
jgi:RNA polymerase sigma-70 factor (ECF subfamily)